MLSASQGPSDADVDAAIAFEEHDASFEVAADDDTDDDVLLEAVRQFESRAAFSKEVECAQGTLQKPANATLELSFPSMVDNDENLGGFEKFDFQSQAESTSKRLCVERPPEMLDVQSQEHGTHKRVCVERTTEMAVGKIDNEPIVTPASWLPTATQNTPDSGICSATSRSPVDVLAQRFAEICIAGSPEAALPKPCSDLRGTPCPIVRDAVRHRSVIHGVEVLFPFENGPLLPQKQAMEHVIQALNSRCHTAIESPTGTGKTAAVLCAALAWQRQRFAEHGQAPQLIFCSRTHAQLRQAIAELRRLPYRPSMAIVGSRESGLCIHPETAGVAEFGGQTSVRQACRQLRRNRSCMFHEGLRTPGLPERAVEHLRAGNAWDIEELARFGAMTSACPYYLAHTAAHHAELVFSPYSYVLDPSVRQNAGIAAIDISNRIVILDEAHNVDGVCCEAGSAEIGLEQLRAILAALRRFLRDDQDPSGGSAMLLPAPGETNAQPVHKVPPNKQLGQLGGFLPFEPQAPGSIGGFSAASTISAVSEQRKKPQLAVSKPVLASSRSLMDLFGRLCSCISERREIAIFAPHQASLQQVKPFLKDLKLLTEPLLKLESTETLQNGGNAPLSGSCRPIARGAALLHEIASHGVESTSLLDLAAAFLTQLACVCESPDSYAACVDPVNKQLLSFWLTTTEPTFAPVSQSTYSLILMSGTLTPLEATVAELGVSFRQRALPPLEVGHIIGRHALTLVTVGHIANTKLECTFRAWKREPFLHAIGKALLCICKSVPGGVLVFLPSYELLQRCSEAWQQQSSKKKKQGAVQRITEDDGGHIWNALAAEKKTIVMEPSPPAGAHAQARSVAQISKTYEQAKRRYEDAVRRDGKALLLAVYRGRMSEGVSFDDDYARGVVCVGIPFPNLTEERLKQKRLCNDFRMGQGLGTVSGDVWYESRAFQAVAQALGRCIRHPNDYGCLVLLDSRWVELGKVANLPKWLQPFLVEQADAAAAANHLSAHFARLVGHRTSGVQEMPAQLLQQTDTLASEPLVKSPGQPVHDEPKTQPGASSVHCRSEAALDMKRQQNSGQRVWQQSLKLPARSSGSAQVCCIDLE